MFEKLICSTNNYHPFSNFTLFFNHYAILLRVLNERQSQDMLIELLFKTVPPVKRFLGFGIKHIDTC